jgi:manganese efflux pump family protein
MQACGWTSSQFALWQTAEARRRSAVRSGSGSGSGSGHATCYAGLVLAALALAFGLAMDATAVCAARAVGVGARREGVILPLLFGLFQAGMAAIGWLGGDWARAYIAEWDHWIAGGVLLVVGAHMIVEGWRHDGSDDEQRRGSPMLYLALAVATSIDAAAAGLTLPLIPAEPWLVLTAIGVVTSVCCVVGFAAGRKLGERIGPRLGIVGGLVLIGIAIDVLIRAP